MSGQWVSSLRNKLDRAMTAVMPVTAAEGSQEQGGSWLLGASHVGALRRAQQERIRLGQGPAVITDILIASLGASRVSKTPFHRIDAGTVSFLDPGYQRNFNTSGIGPGLSSGDRIGVQMGDANGILLDHASYWSRHEPASLCQSGRPPVPQTTLEAICDAESAPVRRFMADLKQMGFHLYWVPYPPIKADHPMFGTGVRPEVIVALDALFLGRMNAAMQALGIPVVARPSAAITPEGLLKTEYSHAMTATGLVDWVHANPAYGDLMLDEVARVL